MGVKVAPDTAQEIMESLLRQLENVEVYIDDIGCFNNSWEDHLQTLEAVLTILQNNNFTVNPLKCEWAVKETDWLGYWLTPVGLKPWRKKIDAILAIEPPTTAKQLRSFIGAVTYYRDMFRRRSHLLSPLTAQAGSKGSINWTLACQQAFDQIKAVLAKDCFLRYPDHNKPFHVYCDASDLQLGAAIVQDGAPVAYYSRKLNAAQRNYTVGEKELLSIVETLKEYHSMLYGCKELHVYTDHRNNTFAKLNTQRVIRWRMFLEDFGPTLHYIKGEHNVLADALSRLPFAERQEPIAGPQSPQFAPTLSTDRIADEVEPMSSSFFSLAIDDSTLSECFVNLPASENVPFELTYQQIAAAQTGDARLQHLVAQHPNRYPSQQLACNTQVRCRLNDPAAPNGRWKIYLPDALLDNAIRWHHLALGHAGMNRTHDTMKLHFYHPDLRNRVETLISNCEPCQLYKNVGRGHGHLAPREVSMQPWYQVAVDCIGPWRFRDAHGNDYTFRALTMIDTTTNLVELIRLDSMESRHVGLQFNNAWLSRYPRPAECVFDQGKEFVGYHFQQILAQHGITRRPTTVKNPQANAICERMHQSIGNTLRTLTTFNPPAGLLGANHLVDTALANAMYATRAMHHGTLRATPGSIAFSRDMIMDIPFVADLQLLQQHRQQIVDRNLIAANQRRFAHDYNVGDQVLKLTYKPDKLQPRATGPFTIETVHTNGTVTLRLNVHTIERISIRRIKPYRQ